MAGAIILSLVIILNVHALRSTEALLFEVAALTTLTTAKGAAGMLFIGAMITFWSRCYQFVQDKYVSLCTAAPLAKVKVGTDDVHSFPGMVTPSEPLALVAPPSFECVMSPPIDDLQSPATMSQAPPEEASIHDLEMKEAENVEAEPTAAAVDAPPSVERAMSPPIEDVQSSEKASFQESEAKEPVNGKAEPTAAIVEAPPSVERVVISPVEDVQPTPSSTVPEPTKVRPLSWDSLRDYFPKHPSLADPPTTVHPQTTLKRSDPLRNVSYNPYTRKISPLNLPTLQGHDSPPPPYRSGVAIPPQWSPPTHRIPNPYMPQSRVGQIRRSERLPPTAVGTDFHLPRRSTDGSTDLEWHSTAWKNYNEYEKWSASQKAL
jgi:hypothetical protein